MGFKSLALLAAIGVTAGVTASVTQSNANIKINELNGQKTELTTQLENEKTEKQQYYEALVESAKTLEAKEILIENLTLDLTAVQNNLATATSNLTLTQTELNNKIILLEESQANILNLQSLIDSANEHKTELMLEIESANATIQNLEQELTTANSDKALIQEQLTAANLNVQNLTNEISTITANNATLQAELNNALAGKSELETSVATLTSERDALQLQINSLIDENSELRNIIEDLQNQLSSSIETTSVDSFDICGDSIMSYLGTDEDVIIPTSYSVTGGETLSFNTFDDFGVFFQEKQNSDYFNLIILLDEIGETVSVSTYYLESLINNYEKIYNYFEEYGVLKVLDNFQCVKGNDYQITKINKEAFKNNSVIKSVKFLENVTFGEGVFYQCSNLTSVELPTGMTKLPESLFYGCSNLTTVNIPDSVTVIDFGVFYGCSSLTNLTLPSNLTSIDTHAFFGCTGLTEITIPATVINLGQNIFRECSTSLKVTILAPIPPALDTNLFSPPRSAVVYVPAGTKSAYESAEVWKDLGVEFIELQ